MNLYAFAMCIAMISSDMSSTNKTCEYIPAALAAAEYYSIEDVVLLSLITHESKWDPNALGADGECGLTQVKPKYVPYSCKELKDPFVSIWVGAEILHHHKYSIFRERSLHTALCYYNAGQRGCQEDESRAKGMRYATRVLRKAIKLKRTYDAIVEPYL